MWALAMGPAARQLRPRPSGGVLGFDMGAVLAAAAALGIDPAAVAELLPAIEGEMVERINGTGARDDG